VLGAVSVVGFVDILGFKELIRRADDDSTLATHLLDAVRIAKKADFAEWFGGPGSTEIGPGLQWLGFSDCVIISSEYRREWSWMVPAACAELAIEILKLGFLCRGGVCRGSLYVGEEIVVGQGLATAYWMEQKLAVYPRIVLAPELVGDLRDRFADIDHPASITQDHDGVWHVDVFRALASQQMSRNGLHELRNRLGDELEQSSRGHRLDVLAKWLWFARRWNDWVAETGRVESLAIPAKWT